MKEKLLRGEWTGVAPLGYSYGHSGEARKIIAGEKGKLYEYIMLAVVL